MLLVVIRKRHRNKNQKRYDRKYYDTRYRQRQQCLIEVFIAVRVEIFFKCVDMLSVFRHLL